MCHRVLLTQEAEVNERSAEDIVKDIIAAVPVPVAGAIRRLSPTDVLTDIPVTVTLVFIENHANEEVASITAETSRSARAGMSFFIGFFSF